MDKKKSKKPVLPWTFPAGNGRYIDLRKIVDMAALDFGIDKGIIMDYLRSYNKEVEKYLCQGLPVIYFEMGILLPELDENGFLETFLFDVFEEFKKIADEYFRIDPSLFE